MKALLAGTVLLLLVIALALTLAPRVAVVQPPTPNPATVVETQAPMATAADAPSSTFVCTIRGVLPDPS